MKRRIRSRKRRSGRRRDFTVEGLEARRLLVGDAFVVGDSDQDGAFGTGDLVQVFQEGKFETGEEATFEQGDWNGDGLFDSSDLVHAFRNGGFDQPQPLAADDGTATGEENRYEGDPNGNEVDEPIDNDPVDETPDEPTDNGDDEDEDKKRPWHHFDRGDRPDPKEMVGQMVDRMIGKLQEGIESGDLPGDMTQEQAEAIIEKLSEARETGDVGPMREMIRDWMEQRKNEHEEERAEKMKEHSKQMAERLSGMLDALKERIDAGHHPKGLSADEAHGFIDGIHAKLQEGEIRDALNMIKELRGPWHRERPDNGEHEGPNGNENPDNGEVPDQGEVPDNGRDRPNPGEIHAKMLGAAIDKMQDLVESGKLPDEAQAILDAARGALEEGDTKAAAKHLAELRHLGHRDHGHHDQGDDDRDVPDNGDPGNGDPGGGDPTEGPTDRDPDEADPTEGATDGDPEVDPNDGDDKPDRPWDPENRERGRWSLEDMKAAFERFRNR